METKFTILFEELRKNYGLSYKNISEKLGYSLTYIFDIAKGNRIPTREIAEKLIILYNLNDNGKRLLYDSIASITNSLPYDVVDYLINNPEELTQVIEKMNSKKANIR